MDGTLLSELDTFLARWPNHRIHAVLVARHGKLVFERYFAGADLRWVASPSQYSAGALHDIRSISKSVTSLLIGIAIGEEKFPPLQSSAVDMFPEHADLRTSDNERITFEHLLTMAHGLAWDEDIAWADPGNNERLMLEARDPYRYVLERPMVLQPGVMFNYSGGATTLLGAALLRSTQRTITDYAREKLFGPLGVTDFEWLGFTGSTEIAAFGGLRLRPRDLAKLGQLVLDKGRWKGVQVIPEDWIQRATTPRMNAEIGALYYGYQWWLGRSLVRGRDVAWIAGFGIGGQRLFVVPELQIVLAINAAYYRSPLQRIVTSAICNQLVLPAVKI
jgi:CubicO group peptidase (beta-lactamase class C family)